MHQLAKLTSKETRSMLTVLRRVGTESGRSCQGCAGNVASTGATSSTRQFALLGSRSAVAKTAIISRSSFPRSRITGSDHQSRRFELPAGRSSHDTMIANLEQERWSGGSGTVGHSSTRRWLWTAAAVAAMTAAAATSNAAANPIRAPIRTPKVANTISCKPDSLAPPTTTAAMVGGRGGEGGCIGKSQVSAIIPAPASNAAGAGRGKSSASAPLEKNPLWRPRSSNAEARYGSWVGAGLSGGSGSSGEGHPVLEREGAIDLEGGVSALRGGRRLEGGAAVGKPKNNNPWAWKAVPLAGRPLFTSVTSTKGHRPYMEDEFFMSGDGSFSAVYDGHGGANVSKYLRQNLYRHFMENLPSDEHDAHDLATVERALKAAYETADDYVTTQTPYCHEGSCAVSVTVHCDRQRKASIISCNVGDSRAVLSRGGKAVDLTEDHKPNAPRELERIYRHDGIVTWEGFESSQGLRIEETGVYRVNGNLAVARAIGDVDCRPWVSGEAEIRTIEINREMDQFVILASDGLWDVMSSEEAVQYVHSVMEGALGAGREGEEKEHASKEAGSGDGSGEMTVVNWAQSYAEDHGMVRAAKMLRKEMASYLTAEAMRRGSMDNTTVAIVWLQ